MTTYAVGDIQGCAGSFDRLLEAIAFDPATDRLWIAGDLVNRGPDSLGVLRRAMALGERATVVLGNHDLHLLAIAAGVRPPAPDDTLDDILAAADRPKLIDWLRCRPLLHHDAEIGCVMVHAGLPPGWSLAEAKDHAEEVSAALAGPGWRDLMQSLYGDEPRAWSPDLESADRRRFTINALTRMRYCDADGRLDLVHHGPPGTQPEALKPWYELRDMGEAHIVFGHWASLGFYRGDGFTCVDNGCVWGRSLTALPLDPPGEPVSAPCVDS